ncbi:MAG: hypothetical protein AVDCRST_MAG59-180, partial [uncultured Thermomicrobiales bacterium]
WTAVPAWATSATGGTARTRCGTPTPRASPTARRSRASRSAC